MTNYEDIVEFWPHHSISLYKILKFFMLKRVVYQCYQCYYRHGMMAEKLKL